MCAATAMASRVHWPLTLETKMDVIQGKEKGQRNCEIMHALGLPESTVRTILSKKDDIVKCVKAYGSSGLDNQKTSDQLQLVKAEQFLALWVDGRKVKVWI